MRRGRWFALLTALMLSFAAQAQEQKEEAKTEPTPEQKLIEAVQGAKVRDVQKLLKEGANASAATELGMPILSYAAYHTKKEAKDLVKALVDAGADVNQKDKPGATPLMYAAAAGDPEIVKMLIAAGADVNAKDNTDWTALMRAAFAGKADAVRSLVEAGADVNVTNRLGRTALKMAEDHNDTAVIEAIQKGGSQ